MTLIAIVCYRCTDCNRIYEAMPTRCLCERQVYIKGEQFGPFIIVEGIDENRVRVKCLLCGNFHELHYTNVRKQQSCGCKPKHVEVLDITKDILVYKCRKCGKNTTMKMPIVSYCCEESTDDN